jgi:hypothetical protein
VKDEARAFSFYGLACDRGGDRRVHEPRSRLRAQARGVAEARDARRGLFSRGCEGGNPRGAGT